MSSEKRKPNWTLCVNDAPLAGSKPHWRSIGAAWETQSGNLFVKVDEGEVLRGTAMMFPYREKSARGGGGYRRSDGQWIGRQPQRSHPTSAPPRSVHDDYEDRHPAAPPTSEPDCMERKRAEWAARPAPPPWLPPTPPGDYDPDPEAPSWLE